MSVPSSKPPVEREERGLRCRQCGCGHLRVVYTRAKAGGRVMRRRECRSCGERVTTWERAIGV
jgi:transcriptional regulator NrdR family protein